MMYVRDEGSIIRSGFNFYPLTSNQFGFVFKLKSFILFVRYNKKLGKIICQKIEPNGERK
jgi:hypothetical protein